MTETARASGVEIRTPSGVLRARLVDLAQGGIDLFVGQAAAEPPSAARAEVHPVDVRADVLALDGESRTATFRGSVALTQGLLTVTCERLTARLSADGEVTSAFAEGSVRVVKGNLDVAASSATFDVARDELVLAGPVMLRRPDAIVEGDRVVISLSVERVTIFGARGRLRFARAARQP